MPPVQVILSIIGIVIIMFACYYVTYYVGMKASGQSRTGVRNKNIVMLDRYAIARDKQFCIVSIAGKVYIVGVTNHTMTLLDTLDAESFAEQTDKDVDETPWNMTPVGQYGNRLTRRLVAFVAEKTGKTRQNKEKNVYSAKPDFADNLKEAEDKSDAESSDIMQYSPEDD